MMRFSPFSKACDHANSAKALLDATVMSRANRTRALSG
jgi:hypothetical protein